MPAGRGGQGGVYGSIAAIGIAPGQAYSDEQTLFNQYTLGNHYVLTKYLSQQEALSFAANGLDLVVVNPCFPFGPGDIVPTPTGQIIVDILKGLNRTYFTGSINIVDVGMSRACACCEKGKTVASISWEPQHFHQGFYETRLRGGGIRRPDPEDPRAVGEGGFSVA